MVKNPKISRVLEKTKQALEAGNYRYSKHALARQGQRHISDADVKNAIFNGWHEARKDEWKQEYRDWNYSIRGPSLAGDHLRIAVSIEEEAEDVIAIVVTVINLNRKDGWDE